MVVLQPIFRGLYLRYRILQVLVCLKYCHQNAYSIVDGVVVRDEDRCIGCRMCVVLCPYNAITSFDGEIIKCDLCGGDPVCVRYCSTGAIEFLDETAELEKRRKEMAEKLAASFGG